MNEEFSFQNDLEGKKRCCTIMRPRKVVGLSAKKGSSELDMVAYACHSFWEVETVTGNLRPVSSM